MPDDYALLDAAHGRKLERFGEVIVARPAPAVEGRSGRAPSEVPWAEYVREGQAGEWVVHRPLPDPWIVCSAGRRHRLELTAAGQVGLFPEQAPLRERAEALLRAGRVGAAGSAEQRAPRVLDLFSYTGGNALAAAAAGAEVTCVDASRRALSWARENAELNELGDAPIRWIAEDAARFVEREVRRGRHYDALWLDPPSFGRAQGRTWKLESDLMPLLKSAAPLLSPTPCFVLLSAHTRDWKAQALAHRLDVVFAQRPGRTTSGVLGVNAASGARLILGVWAMRDFHG